MTHARPEQTEAGLGEFVPLLLGPAQRGAILKWLARMSLRQVRPMAAQDGEEDGDDRR
jgi:hypothetical protein